MPGWAPALPGWSNAAFRRSFSARRPTWSRAVTAASGSDQVGAGTALLGGDDRSQHAVDRGVQSLDDRMVLVEPRAVDFDDELGARLVERVALQLLDRIADHLAIEVSGTRSTLEAGKGRLVRGATGANHQPAPPGRAREALRERLLRATHGDSGAVAGVTCTSSSNNTGRSTSGSGAG